jgi:hypothetical protein
MTGRADRLKAFDEAVRYFASGWDSALPEQKWISIADKPYQRSARHYRRSYHLLACGILRRR